MSINEVALPKLTRLYSFPNAPTESATDLTIRIQNILCSPTISRFEVTYKLYRKQSEKLMMLHFGNQAVLYCFCGNAVYEVGTDLEPVLLKQKAWTLRQTMKIVGSVHEIVRRGLGSRDKCRISVGVISQGPSTKGVVLELQQPAITSAAMPTEGHLDEQVLRDVMGSRFETLMMATDPATSVVLSTGTALPVDVSAQSEKLQMATAYFEMFSKL